MKKRVLFFGLFILFIAAACNKNAVCIKSTTVNTNIQFSSYTDSNKTIDTLLPQSVIFFDTFYSNLINTNNFAFQLSSIADSTAIYIQADSNLPMLDTVHFYYTRQLHFITKECGYNYYFTINNVLYTKNIIKKINIINSAVTQNSTNYNVQIIY